MGTLNLNRQFYPFLEVSSVARLPVPPLRDTLSKYLEWAEPLIRPSSIAPHHHHQQQKSASSSSSSSHGAKKTAPAPTDPAAQLAEERDWARTRTAVAQFAAKEVGGQLQAQLQELADTSPTSWLEGMWDTGYLAYRVPAPVHVNPFFALEDDPLFNKENSTTLSSSGSPLALSQESEFGAQAGRGASLIAASLRFLSLVRGNALEPERERDGTPLCMCQYGRIFGSCRIPMSGGRDELRSTPGSRHVIVARGGEFFWFDVLDAGGDVMAEADIRSNLLKILVADSEEESLGDGGSAAAAGGGAGAGAGAVPASAVGLFTTLDRDEWALRREELVAAGALNVQSLRVIETALFLVCLDDEEPRTYEELSTVLLHSDGRNRFFDKSIQIIVCKNAKAGINMEHSGIDGQTVLRFAAAIYLDSVQNRDQTTESLTLTSSPTKLRWAMTPSLEAGLRSADKQFRKFVASVDTSFLGFEDFGKKFAIANRISPDALVQLAYQLAYFRLFGRPGSTYESVSTKNFYHGRTECLRSATKDALAMCKTMDASDATAEHRAAAIRDAAAAHIARAKECKKGLGVDRHLLGLLTMAKKNRDLLPGVDIPAVFLDQTYARYTTDMMSTSNCGNDALCVFGFGPVVPGGLGLGYIIRPDAIHVNITSNTGIAKRYHDELQRALRDIAAALVDGTSNEAPRARL